MESINGELLVRHIRFQRSSPHSHYTPTKAGILSLMQSCAVALGKYNIRANAVLPGTIETDINKEDLSDTAKREGMIKRTALGRLGGMSYCRMLFSSLADIFLLAQHRTI